MVFMSYKDGRDYVWRAFDLIRAYTSDFSILLYLLHAYRKGFLESFRYDEHIVEYLNRELEKRRGELPDYEYQLLKVFIPALETFQYNTQGLQNMIIQFSLPGNDWYDEHEARLFDDILSTVNEWEGKASAECTQPYELTQFVSAISGYDGNGVMYNPFAGSATYCVEMSGNGSYVGQELSIRGWAIGVLRLLAHKLSPVTFLCEDSFRYWKGEEQQFDCIVATPPFALIANIFGERVHNAEEVFIKNSLDCMTPNGITIGVFASGLTFRGAKTLELRRQFIEEDKLDTVIQLPAGVFRSTSIPTVVLKFSNHKEKPGIVRLVDGSSFFEKERVRNIVRYDRILEVIRNQDPNFFVEVPIDALRNNDYIISPKRFLQKDEVIPEGFEKRPLSDYVDVVGGQRCTSAEGKARVINIASLSSNPFEFELDVNTLPEEELKEQYRKITEPVLLLSKVRTLKPTFVKASEDAPIYVHANVLATKLKGGSVYVPGLVLAISQVTDFQTGAIIPHITQSTILSLPVLLPKEYAAQEAFFRSAERERKEAQVRELGLGEIIQAQKAEFISVIRRRRHDLNNMLGDLRHSINAVSAYLQKKGYDKDVMDEDLNLSVEVVLSSIDGSIDSIADVLRHLDDEEKYSEPVRIDLIQKLKAKQDEVHSNFRIRYTEDDDAFRELFPDEEEPHANVMFGAVNLDRVLFNIIQNAEKHGFTDPTRMDYMVEIELSYDYESGCYVIRFKNNGNPLPANMDTNHYCIRGEKAGVTGGNGYGGAIVASTIAHYGGSIRVIPKPDEVFTVCIELKIPRCDE